MINPLLPHEKVRLINKPGINTKESTREYKREAKWSRRGCQTPQSVRVNDVNLLGIPSHLPKESLEKTEITLPV